MVRLPLLAFLALSACGNWDDERGAVAASGAGGTRSFAATGFTSVELRGGDDVEVRVGPAFNVSATGDAAALERLLVQVHDGELRVGRRRGFDSNGVGKARVLVTMPALVGASVAGSGNLKVDRVEGDRLDASIAGSGALGFGAVSVRSATLSIAGSGDVSARGEAGQLAVNIAGSGNVDAPSLVAREAEISIAGSGDVRATVKGRASVNSMGSGDVDLGPDARCEARTLGSGKVRCG